jgi:O-antigen/teichoic acid export membrane protein
MRGLLSGWGKLVSTNVLGAVLQLAVFALAAQVLDLAALGVLVLIQTWAKVAEALVGFQSVSVLTRYLAEADECGESARFRGLVKAGLLVDGGGALAATLVAIALVPLAGGWFGLPPEWYLPAQIYAAVILTRIVGVTEASLRCFDCFWLIGLRPVMVAAATLLASLVMWIAGTGPQAWLYGWLVGEVLVNIAFLAMTMVELRRHGIRGVAGADARTALAQSPGFWRMLWQTYATFSVRILSQDADVLVASSLLGPSAAALLRAAKNVAAMVSQLGRPLQQVAAGPLARYTTSGNSHAAWNYALRISLIAGLAGLGLALMALLVGEYALTLAFGEDFVAAAPVMVALMLNAALYMFGIVLLPFGIALDRSDIALRTTLLGTACFAALLPALTGAFGLVGIGWAHVVYNAVWLVSGWALSYRALFADRNRQAALLTSGAK